MARNVLQTPQPPNSHPHPKTTAHYTRNLCFRQLNTVNKKGNNCGNTREATKPSTQRKTWNAALCFPETNLHGKQEEESCQPTDAPPPLLSPPPFFY